MSRSPPPCAVILLGHRQGNVQSSITIALEKRIFGNDGRLQALESLNGHLGEHVA
jgi:hypothetical protein